MLLISIFYIIMESNNIEIEYMEQKVNVLQYLSESKSQFNQRLEYIKRLEKNQIVWKEANRLSKIWYCIKFKNCRYQHDVYYSVIKHDK
jgi:hypothetical protein